MNDNAHRRELHHRQLDLRFFERDDGLFEIEARLTDVKTLPFRRLLQDQDTPAGAAIHDIVVRMVVDENYLVHDASASMAATPFQRCRGAANTLAPLVGLTMGAGWNKRVRELLGAAASCTHIVELLGPMATTVYQGLAPRRLARMAAPGNDERKTKVDSCYAYARDGEVVARLWPDLYRPSE